MGISGIFRSPVSKAIWIKCHIFTVFTIFLVFLAACQNQQPDADLILTNARVITIDERRPVAEAVAVHNQRIMAVGSTAEMEELKNERTEVIDLNGATVVPGFIDSHAHFLGLGRSKMQLNLNGATDWAEIVQRTADAVQHTPGSQWIIGRGWHQEKWRKAPAKTVEGYPTHHALSTASPDHAVMLTHASGHALIANAKAMELAGVDAQTPDPEGGRILRLENGSPSGVFLENAEMLIRSAYRQWQKGRSPQEKEKEVQTALQKADQACLRNGITTLHDAGASFKEIDRIKRMVAQGRLNVRLWMMLQEDNRTLRDSIDLYGIEGFGKHHLTVGGIKRYMDGALGAHGAWLLSPYRDMPGSSGLNVTPLSELQETASIALEHGFQLCTHAIGDRANRETLNIYERVLKNSENGGDRRWRIEHAQHLHPADIPRFATLGVIASMQPIHCTSDAPWVIKRLGETRAQAGAYVWKNLIQSGAVICNGTDAPVEALDPIANFYAAVTRKTLAGETFYPEQAMSREQALRAYTINGAYAAFEEEIKGSITEGKLADFTVLSQNIMEVPAGKIKETNVLYTIIGGKVVYEHAAGVPE